MYQAELTGGPRSLTPSLYLDVPKYLSSEAQPGNIGDRSASIAATVFVKHYCHGLRHTSLNQNCFAQSSLSSSSSSHSLHRWFLWMQDEVR